MPELIPALNHEKLHVYQVSVAFLALTECCIASCPCWPSSCILGSFAGDDEGDGDVHVNVHVNGAFTRAAS